MDGEGPEAIGGWEERREGKLQSGCKIDQQNFRNNNKIKKEGKKRNRNWKAARTAAVRTLGTRVSRADRQEVGYGSIENKPLKTGQQEYN